MQDNDFKIIQKRENKTEQKVDKLSRTETKKEKHKYLIENQAKRTLKINI